MRKDYYLFGAVHAFLLGPIVMACSLFLSAPFNYLILFAGLAMISLGMHRSYMTINLVSEAIELHDADEKKYSKWIDEMESKKDRDKFRRRWTS